MAKTPHFVLHRLALPTDAQEASLFPLRQTWLGVVLPKRQARRAVTRNALRRQIYEVARSAASRLPEAFDAAHGLRGAGCDEAQIVQDAAELGGVLGCRAAASGDRRRAAALRRAVRYRGLSALAACSARHLTVGRSGRPSRLRFSSAKFP